MDKREVEAESRLCFLQSTHWGRIRGLALLRDGNCRLCSSDGPLEVHHRWYPDNPYEVRVQDVTTLCRRCHQGVHRHVIGQNSSASWGFEWWPFGRRRAYVSPWFAYAMARRLFR